MNLYLDVDGVLIGNEGKLANFAEDFLHFLLTAWPNSTYWLTSYCWNGQNRATDIVSSLIKSSKTRRLIQEIKPAKWHYLKTDGIDFHKPFLWFDDSLTPEEKQILLHYNARVCHRKISLINDPNQLLDELSYLKTLT